MSEQRPPSLRLYAAAAAALEPFIPWVLARRARRGKEDEIRIGERLGRANLSRPAGPLLWLHGVSVGEGLSLLPLIARLRDLRPGASILVTTGTRASAQVMAQRLPSGAFHQYAPVDTPGAVRRFLDHWRPDLGVFVESELWPNLILGARASGARLALISAKMSDRSFQGWRRVGAAARATLAAFDLILARDAAAAARLSDLGARADGLWDAKLGAPPLPADGAELDRLKELFAGAPVVLAASTHPGEEALIASAFAVAATQAKAARLVVVPRHAERGQEVAQRLRELGLITARRACGDAIGDAQAIVADTLGELGLWYRLASLAIVGGSLVEGIGGHNPLEPARLSCPFVAGSHVEHWPIYRDLAGAGATQLIGADALAGWIGQALAAEPALTAMAERASDYARRRDSESEAIAPRLLALIEA